MATGIAVQKYIGLGNIPRAVDVPYPTAAAPVPSVVQATEIRETYQGQIRLFILAGQSNMVGWAPIPDDEKGDPPIYVSGKDYRWRSAAHPIEDASGQVDMVSENLLAGFGPAMYFARVEHHPEL